MMKRLGLLSLCTVWVLLASSASAAPSPPTITTPLPSPIPIPAGPAIAPPTHLRPVQSKADCEDNAPASAVFPGAPDPCDAVAEAGDLQLIWDESDKAVTGYKVYRVDPIGAGHKLLGTVSTSYNRYYLVKKPSEGYANLCFAVAASVGNRTSADSSHYCYGPGGTATTRSFKPSHTVTQVAWTAPNVTCGGPPLPGSAFFRAADKYLGSAFTVFFPFLTSEQPISGRVGVSGVYAGNETAILEVDIHNPNFFGQNAFCSVPNQYVLSVDTATAQVNALSGVAFDLGELAKHKFYSASLTLKPSQILTIRLQKRATLSNSGWCATFVAAANREWWLAPLGNLTYGKSGLVTVGSRPKASIDVTSLVSAWASVKYANNYGFIVGNPSPPGPSPPASQACLTKFATPSLKVWYF
jgi:hypothetical protein